MFRPGIELKLARAPAGYELPLPRAGDGVLRRLDGDRILDACTGLSVGFRAEALPRKTPQYFRERYIKHPIYSYRVHLVELAGKAVALLVSRLAERDGARALRIVDFYGESSTISSCGGAIAKLLDGADAEYADIWEHGLNSADLRGAGFGPVSKDGDLIVPNLFEPFVADTSRITFAVKNPDNVPIMIFRADGDQDRPNLIPRSGA